MGHPVFVLILLLQIQGLGEARATGKGTIEGFFSNSGAVFLLGRFF